MIRSIFVTIALLLVFGVAYAQSDSNNPQSHIQSFDEKLFLHVVSEGNQPSSSLLEYRDSKNEILLAQNLTSYSYSDELEDGMLSQIENSQLLLDLVKRDIENGNFEGAKAALDNATISDFNKSYHDDYQFYKAYLLFVHKDFAKARDIFDKAASLKGEFKPSSIYYSAFCDLFMDDLEKSAGKFASIRNQATYREEIPFYLSLIQYKQGEFKEVIATLKKHVNRSTSMNADNMRDLLTRSHFREGNWGQLTDILLKDKNCCKSNEEHYFVGLSLFKQGDYVNAKKHLDKAAKLKSKEGQNALLALGQIHIDNNTDQAIPYLVEASQSNYDLDLKDQAFLALSNAYELKEDPVNATKYAQRVSKDSKYYDIAINAEVRLMYERREYKKALKTLVSLNDLNPSLEILYQDLLVKNGLDNYKRNNLQAASQFLNEAALLTYNSKSQKKAQFFLARISYEKKEYAKTLSYLKSYFENPEVLFAFDSDQLQARYINAYSNLNLNRHKFAVKDFNQVEKLVLKAYKSNALDHYEQMYADVILRQADVHFSLGNKKKAENYYDKAYQQGSQYPDYALYQRGKIEDLQNESYLQISTYEQLEKEFPNSKYVIDSKLKRANVFQQLNKSKEAFDLYASVYKSPKASDNDIFIALMRLGLISYNQGDVQTALIYYKKIFDSNTITDAQSNEALTLVEEIYLNNLKDSEGYFAFVDRLGTHTIASHDRDSIDYNIAMDQLGQDIANARHKFEYYLDTYKIGAYRESSLLELAKIYESIPAKELALSTYQELYNMKGKSSLLAISKIIHLFSSDEEKIDKYIEYNRAKISDNYSKESNEIAYSNIAKASVKAENLESNEKEVLTALQGSILTNDEKEQIRYELALAYFEVDKNSKGMTILNQLSTSKNAFLANSANYMIAERLYASDKREESILVLDKLMSQSEMNKTLLCKAINLRSEMYIDKGEFDVALAGLESVLEQTDIDIKVLQRTDELIKKIAAKKKELGEKNNPTLELEYVYNAN